MITDNQILHRQYLGSEVWKAKRLEALNFYGCKCSRCDGHGTDVHHRTYVRAGGAELMSDLEVMCRSCHEAHHAAERVSRGRRRPSFRINRQALFRVLTSKHRQLLGREFSLSSGELYLKLVDQSGNEVINRAEVLLGRKSAGGIADKAVRLRPTDQQERDRLITVLSGYGIKLEKLNLTKLKILRNWFQRINETGDVMGTVGKKHVIPEARPAIH